MHSRFHFKFVVGCNVTSKFSFYAANAAGSLEICEWTPDPSKVNPHAKIDWQREYVERVNTVYKFWHPTLPFTPEFVDEFNAWRTGTHLEAVAQMQAAPEKYGTWAEIEHLCPPPAVLRGVVWRDDRWAELERKRVIVTGGPI